MKTIEFRIPGEPVAKGRPRFTRFSRRPYTPEKTAAWEMHIKVYAAKHRPQTPPTGAISCVLVFSMPIPKSIQNNNKAMSELAAKFNTHIKKPDLDNLAKSVLDALQGAFFVDDCQICDLALEKRYRTETGVYVQLTYHDGIL